MFGSRSGGTVFFAFVGRCFGIALKTCIVGLNVT